MTELEWKLFRNLQQLGLERFCQRVLSEVGSLVADTGKKSNHERYLELYKLIEQRDQELGETFDNPRRSTALRQLACMKSLELLSDEEFARFSQETRNSVGVWL